MRMQRASVPGPNTTAGSGQRTGHVHTHTHTYTSSLTPLALRAIARSARSALKPDNLIVSLSFFCFLPPSSRGAPAPVKRYRPTCSSLDRALPRPQWPRTVAHPSTPCHSFVARFPPIYYPRPSPVLLPPPFRFLPLVLTPHDGDRAAPGLVTVPLGRVPFNLSETTVGFSATCIITP